VLSLKIALAALVALLLAQFALRELRTSTLQARHLSAFARKLDFRVEPGASASIGFPPSGPFDERLGYTRIPSYVERLRAQGYEIGAQARQSQALLDYARHGFYAAYREKTQAGLQVLDCRAERLFDARYPQRVYADFDAVPPLVVDTLAFIENRELLAARDPKHNPVVELPRLAKAVVERAIVAVDPDYPAAGGSTLATQIEKYRHSPEGRTASIGDKLRQMISASVRLYRDGEETLPARRRIIADYLDSVPLGARPGYGEVHGIGDGLWAWYGADFDAVNRVLRLAPPEGAEVPAQALTYRQVLSLIIAQRRPSLYFGAGQEQLTRLGDSYLRLLADGGVISAALRDAALPLRPALREDSGRTRANDYTARKAANLVRVQLAALLDTPRLYDLDRLDLSVTSSIDGALQATVSEQLRRLRESRNAKAAGLVGPHLLERGDPARLFYSFTLYERTEASNRLRVQADNLDEPFDINAGAKLELGSTAKLRTLITYLEVVAALHERYAGLSEAELRRVEVARRDRLTRWAVDHLSSATDKSLPAMLEAAMQRRYSANPGETFFTGGGAHTFENFKRADNYRSPTVAEAFQDSINLAFIRLMRDVVHHYIYRSPGTAARLLEEPDNPHRAALLSRFADREGSTFIRHFYGKYRGKSAAEILEVLAGSARASPESLAAVFRTLEPDASLQAFGSFLREHLPAKAVPPAVVQPKAAARRARPRHPLAALYERHAPGHYSLADRGFLARVHPLELWVAAYLREHPDAKVAQVLDASRAERQQAYGWLFQPHARAAQDTRISTLLEIDAFSEIHRAWQRLGYPFEYLVPSYATAIGSSGDRPSALAELMGIVVNGGRRYPTTRVEQMHFGAGTPYETVLDRQPAKPERVLAPEIAATVRRALEQVVEQGTARRILGALDLADGTRVPLGGKTGTGDNRTSLYGARGRLIESRVLNRTATFVFFIGKRHFGTVTAYVPGAHARDYRFTSALPAQILKTLAPLLRPIAAAREDSPGKGRCAEASTDRRAGPVAKPLSRPFVVRKVPPFDLPPPGPRPDPFEHEAPVEWMTRAASAPAEARAAGR
jgi:membrane peptidoglycan carboxypeptidase